MSFADTIEVSQIEIHRDRGYDYLDIYTTGWIEAKGKEADENLKKVLKELGF